MSVKGFFHERQTTVAGEFASLRSLVQGDRIVVAPVAYDALSAILVQQAGFPCVYLGGNAQIASTLGLPDLGLITLTEMRECVRRTAARIDLPIIVDADVGYGSLLLVQRAVHEFEAAGASAIQIEDQVSPKKCCNRASEVDIVLVMENHNHGGFVKSSEDATRIFQEVGSEHLKLLLDTGNYVDGIVSIEKTIHIAHHIHARMKTLDAQGNEATIDYPKIFALCKKFDYQGFVSIEYEGKEDEFTAIPRGLNRLREIYKKA